MYFWHIFKGWFEFIWWLSLELPSENLFSVTLTFEWAAFLPNVVCSLILSFWESVALPPCGETIIPLGECAFQFWIMSYILFEVGAFSSLGPVSVVFAAVGDCTIVKILMMMWVLHSVFGSGRRLLIEWSFWANVTCSGWYSALFLMLKSPILER